MIDLKLNSDAIDKAYIVGSTFKHPTGNTIKLFPFRTKGAEKCVNEFRLFNGIVGECFRIARGEKFDPKFKTEKSATFNTKLKEYIIEQAKSKVSTDYTNKFEEILQSLFFEDKNRLIKFNGQVLPYMNFTDDHPALKDISRFFLDVLVDKKTLQEISDSSSSADNLFYQLLVECLPEHKDQDYGASSIPFTNEINDIQILFRSDFETLSSDKEGLLNNIENLFKLYYFFYMIQLTKRLNHFGQLKEMSPVYFTLDWEAISASRIGYEFGWKSIEPDVWKLFTHANTVELLNYISINGKQLGSYEEIFAIHEKLDDQSGKQLIKSVTELRKYYVNICPVDLNEEEALHDVKSALDKIVRQDDCDLLQEIKHLYVTVDFVLEKTGRKAAGNRYADWIYRFIKINYTKTRGNLGLTTNLTQEVLLFLVKLCVGKENKIRLNQLWKEMERRGIIFDEGSKTEIIKLFERINLLEKKSDSGDAQYVKSII